MGKDDKLTDITAKIRAETKLAILLYDGKRSEWFPKSQVENNGDGTFTMPTWLALECGFI